MTNGHLEQWLRALAAAVLVVAVLPLIVGPVWADARVPDPPPTSERLEVSTVTSSTVVEFGDPLVYTLTVRALGTLAQTAVMVRDGIPTGTTYASGSAACDTAGPCMESFRNHEVTWELGAMEPGATRTVTFRVTVDTPRTTIETGIPAVTIRNTGLGFSDQAPVSPSNAVVTEVVAVGGVKTGRPRTARARHRLAADRLCGPTASTGHRRCLCDPPAERHQALPEPDATGPAGRLRRDRQG